ncbi:MULTISPECIES: DUF982 domain-containing protein [unclassified Mesorhizobium]|uniref:DUF982 domain-containing protein n=1 Tax=unclassified Mesorhizobium TaxID=325217 RepID=UPI00333DFB08
MALGDLAVRVCMAAIFDEREPEEARKAFLAAAEVEGTLRSPLIRAGDWKVYQNSRPEAGY